MLKAWCSISDDAGVAGCLHTMIFGARDQGGIAAELSNDHAYFSCRSSLATSAGQKDVLQDNAWSRARLVFCARASCARRHVGGE